MANRYKENEKNEKIIRGLTKLSENRKCINCGSLGPQYVCTNFAIFICTACSGIHREFTHRVKSISMATFTPSEVTALQAGGNQRAREIYFKEWDFSRQSLPDPSHPEKLRDFIRTVYVDKRFSGDRKERLSDADEYDSRNRPRYAQSPAYEDRDDRRYSNKSGSRGSERGFDEKMSPARFEERERYDRGFQNERDRDRDRDRRFEDNNRDRERRYEEKDRFYDDRDRRYDDRERRGNERDRFNDRDRYEDQRRWEERDNRGSGSGGGGGGGGGNRRSSEDFDKRPARPGMYRGGETPPLRSVRDILGDDVPKLRVEDGARGTNGRAEEGESPHSVSSSQGDGRLRSFKSVDSIGNNGSVRAPQAPSAAPAPPPAPVQPVVDSLIDFGADPEPPKPAPPPPATSTNSAFDPFGTNPAPPVSGTSSPFDPFGASEPAKANPDPFATGDPFVANPNPNPNPSPSPRPSGAFDPFAASDHPGSTSGWASFDTPPKPAPALAPTPADSFFNQTGPAPAPVKPAQVNGVQHQWTAQQQQQPAGPNAWSMPTGQNLQEPWNSSFLHQPQQQPVQQQPHFMQPQPQQQQQQQAPADNGPQRREIPQDIFYSPAPPLPYNGGMYMQMRPGFGFPQAPGFGAPMPGPMPSYGGQPPLPSNKSNPFDLAADSNPPAFPNMSQLQSALPSFNPGPLSTPAPPPQWSHAGFGAPPASFPPASFPPAMPGPGFNQQQMPPQMMPHFAPGHMGRPSSQMMNGPMGYNNPVQPAAGGGNPFG